MGGMKRVVVAAHRPWAQRMFFNARTDRDGWVHSLALAPDDLLRFCDRATSRSTSLDPLPDIVLLIGWSWLVPPSIYERVPTICVHPSPLPKYRGGSPLQHQIINGETESALTFFLVVDGPVDSGPIYAQEPFSLDGSLDEIFANIEMVGARLIPYVLRGVYTGALGATPQDESQATSYPRRKPEQSEIDVADLTYQMTARQLSDKVRALAHPDYPRAFIKTSDGKRLELWDVRIDD